MHLMIASRPLPCSRLPARRATDRFSAASGGAIRPQSFGATEGAAWTTR